MAVSTVSQVPLISSTPATTGASRQPCWYYLSMVLIILSNAVVITIMVQDGFALTSKEYADSIVKECGFNEVRIPSYRYFDSGVCHYTRIWMRLKGHTHLDPDTITLSTLLDVHCFIHTILMGILVLCIHYVVASGILLIGGFGRENPLAFLPWIVFEMGFLLMLLALTVAEATVFQSTSFSGACMMLYLGLAFGSLTFLATVVTCIQIKQLKDMETAVVKFDYFRF